MLLPHLDRQTYAAGDVIFREGDTGDCAYLIESGAVDLHVRGGLLATLAANAIFGEMALIDGEPRMATATSTAKTTVIILPKKLLESRLVGVDPFIARIIHILVKNVRTVTDKAF